MSKKIVYIIGTYPLLTTTFIDREVISLYRWGVDLEIFAIRRPPEESPLSSREGNLLTPGRCDPINFKPTLLYGSPTSKIFWNADLPFVQTASQCFCQIEDHFAFR